MTTAFQTVFDNAESIAINKRRKVAQTVARDGTVKATSLGGQTWEFEVQMPAGPRWTDYRQLIEAMEALDRVSVGQVQISDSGLDWLSGYQGDVATPTAITADFTSGNSIEITGGLGGLSSGYIFRAGDFIQLGSSGSVYTVTADVAYNDTTVTLHRPVREAAGSYTLIVGQSVTWDVICVQFPQWNIFARNQISWDGPFVFAEAL
jgi:hypothetical protein